MPKGALASQPPWPPALLQAPGLGKVCEAAVVGFFRLGREAAAGKFLAGQVILDAVTACAPLAAGCIGASAVFQILLLLSPYTA